MHKNRVENTSENLKKVRRFRYLIRRAHWLERRLATRDTARQGHQFDEAEYKELMDIFKEVGLEYVAGTYDEEGNFIPPPGETPAEQDEIPPTREEVQVQSHRHQKGHFWSRRHSHSMFE